MSEAIAEVPTLGPRPDAEGTPIGELDLMRPDLFHDDYHVPVFKRLRDEAPVIAQEVEDLGRVWHVTRFEDIMAVDTNHDDFSSEGSIVATDQEEDFPLPMFIAMDPPKHDQQRREVSGVVAPRNLASMEQLIRGRCKDILVEPSRGETFNWVDLVSIELTTQMLATLFDFPFEDRRKLTRWSDVATADEQSGIVESEDARRAELVECLTYFTELWNQRVNAPPSNDLISMLAHGESTKNMDPMEYLGNLILLIVGGNDTTRNSISGGVRFLNEHPAEFEKLKANPRPHSQYGARNHSLPNAAGLHAANHDETGDHWRSVYSRGRTNSHVVRLGKPR